MRFIQNESAQRNGKKLVQSLSDGTFKKNYRPNHGPEFTRGLEELHRYRFNMYLGSCGCFLMEKRLEKKLESRKGGYCG
ncbi:MAG: hypothetical protein K2N15_07030 [Lachnospiraceae bacterium]|nr:hypothetical protein [Lachnospiraceae bacterium]